MWFLEIGLTSFPKLRHAIRVGGISFWYCMEKNCQCQQHNILYRQTLQIWLKDPEQLLNGSCKILSAVSKVNNELWTSVLYIFSLQFLYRCKAFQHDGQRLSFWKTKSSKARDISRNLCKVCCELFAFVSSWTAVRSLQPYCPDIHFRFSQVLQQWHL